MTARNRPYSSAKRTNRGCASAEASGESAWGKRRGGSSAASSQSHRAPYVGTFAGRQLYGMANNTAGWSRRHANQTPSAA